MLTPEDRFYHWDDLRDRISNLFSHVEDVLDFKFKPYGKIPDVDTPYVLHLFKALDVLNDFAVEHYEKLEREYSEWLDLQDEIYLDDLLDDALNWIYIELDDERGVLVA